MRRLKLPRLRRDRGERGQSTVEFALILPVFLLMILGVVDLGQGFYQYAQMVNGVREGARVATYNQDLAAIRTAVKSSTTLGLVDGNITITCYDQFTVTTKTCANPMPLGDGMKVSATRVFSPFTGRIISIVGANVNITATAMRSVQ